MVTPEPIWKKRLRAVVAAAFVAMALVFGTIFVNWPFTQDGICKGLESLSGRKVTVGSFNRIYFPPGFVATDVRFLRHDHPESPAMITVKRLAVAGDWGEILTFHHYLPRIDVYETHILVPPRGVSADGKHHTLVPPLTKAASKNKLQIHAIHFHGATVDFLPGEEGVQPFRIPIRDLILTRVGADAPFGFEGVVKNPMPHGDVYEKGTFGPWSSEDPSRTPIKGTFLYQNAQLSDIRGISGTMQTQGKFEGTLDRIEVEGTATIPDFQVLHSLHKESLKTKYAAAVDGTNGNVELQQVDTTFGHTTVFAKGRVAGEPNRKGRFAVLEARVEGGRVEELEEMFTHAKVAALSGAISIQTSVILPPGDEPFLKRLQMAGHFETWGDKFQSKKTQGLVNRLAESGKGETKKEQDVDLKTVPSAMKARVVVQGGVARITNLMVTAPETAARIDGTYNLLSKDVDLKGTLKTDGKLSDTETGFKSFAVKMFTPFLKKHGSTVVPFQITGKMGDLTTRLDLGAKRKL